MMMNVTMKNRIFISSSIEHTKTSLMLLRFFSSTHICLSDSSFPSSNDDDEYNRLAARLEALKKGSVNDDISLTEGDKSKLDPENLSQFVKEISQSTEKYFSEISEDDIFKDRAIESFREIFGEEIANQLRDAPDKKAFMFKMMENEESLERFIKWSQDPRAPRELQDVVLEGYSAEREAHKGVVSDHDGRLSSVEAETQRLADVTDKLERNMGLITECVELGKNFFKHVDSAGAVITGATAVAPLFAFNRIYKVWADHHLHKISPQHSFADQARALNHNNVLRGRFLRRAIPAVMGVYAGVYVLKSYFPVLTLPKIGSSGEGSSSRGVASLIFFPVVSSFGAKYIKKAKIQSKLVLFMSKCLFYLIALGISTVLFGILPVYYPITLSHKYILLVLGLYWVWYIGLFILECVELYIMLIFALDPKYIVISDNYIYFIKNWLINLKYESRLKWKAQNFRERCVGLLFNLLFMFILGIITYLYCYYIS